MVPVSQLAIFDNLTGTEVLLVGLVALLVLGPERLPEVARTIGQWIAKLKSMSAGLQDEMREVLDDPAMQPLKEVGQFVAQPRRKMAEYIATAEREAATESAAELEPAPDTTEPDSTTEPGAGG